MTAPVPNEKLPRFIELVRVSSKKQGDADTPEVQRRALDKLRQQRPGVLVERIEDGASGLSGALGLAQRPDLQKLAKLAKVRAFDECRVYDVDRLTRSDNSQERMAIFTMIQAAGAVIVDRNGHETDPSDASGMGEIDFFLRTFFSAQERKKIIDRTVGGRKRTAAAGKKPQGQTPFGFVYDADAKTWAVHEERAKVVRSIFQMTADGMSISRIADKLMGDGIPSPTGAAKWNRSKIGEMLRSPLYKGEHSYRFGSESFPCAVPRIISDDLFGAAGAALSRRNLVPVRQKYNHPALLRMRAVCQCGCAIYTDCSRTYSEHRNRYVCGSRKQGKKCEARNHPIPSVDAAVWQMVGDALRDPKWLEGAISKYRGRQGVGEWQSQIAGCEKKLGELKKKESAVLRMLGDGLAESACREQLKTLAKQRETAQRSLETARKGQAMMDAAAASTASLEAQVAHLRTMLDATDFATREKVIAAVTPEDGHLVTLHHDGTIDLHGILSAQPSPDQGRSTDLSVISSGSEGAPRKLSAAARWTGQFPRCSEGANPTMAFLPFRLTATYILHPRVQRCPS